ncbi:DUF2065 domain-containing protein [Desulfoprunum benzoelyticum]|uniref:DUF2065 domain-containing protein n=1 Tax=Desulfoprunum benzoelyticum TaxID=1506996 RepID=A0A840UY54_9BACT|nr:DUF2065 domain-containing protein [Desulfoprunum benzoelyticum]MBB5346399.1 hypothetical protein [Desulfoprunum benzoelyticum]MBM9528602.1 DUF2065 domain-containing protein [Desulfoprunum benzoelyticum]
MKLFLLLVGMVFILEGLPYVAFPEAMRGWLAKLSQTPAGQLRVVGLVVMVVGFLLCWVVQRTDLFVE